MDGDVWRIRRRDLQDAALSPAPLPGPATLRVTVSDGDPSVDCADNLSVTVNCDTPPAQPYSWVELGSGGVAIARVITVPTPRRPCPSINVDGTAMPMNLRIGAGTIAARTSSASPVKPIGVPGQLVCELTLPVGAVHASVYGGDLPLPKGEPAKIIIIGDTGCRLKTEQPVAGLLGLDAVAVSKRWQTRPCGAAPGSRAARR